MAKPRPFQTENSRTALTVPPSLYEDENRECVEAKEPKKFTQFLAAVIATLSALAMGTTLSWSSPAILMLQRDDSPLQVTNAQGSWLGSLLTLGACIGAVPAGALAKRIGAKKSLLLLAVPVFLHWIYIAFRYQSDGLWGLYAARLVAGLSIGAISVAAPMYVSELAHTSIRGTLGTFFQVQITIGLLVEYILGGATDDFQMLALLSSVPALVFVAAFAFMPETPAHLFALGEVEGARRSLAYLRGGEEWGYDLDEEMARVAEDIKLSSANRFAVSDWMNRPTVKALVISLGLMVFQQFSGINAVLFYAGQIFKEAGSAISPAACSVLIGAIQVVATLASTVLIDRTGRKILLFISALVMSLCLVTLGVYFHLKELQDLSHLNSIPIVTLAMFIVFFSIGFGPIPWIMMGEMFSSKTKGLAGSLSAAFCWISAFTVTKQFPTLLDQAGAAVTFGLFAVICAVAVVFVLVLVPETKGKDIVEVQVMLKGKSRRCKNCSGKCEKTSYV